MIRHCQKTGETNHMAGYSSTPLAKKLGIKAGHRLALVDAPDDFESLLVDLPDTTIVHRTLRGKQPAVPTDLTENVVRRIGLAAGLVDNKVCAIDDTWSGLRFVRRLADRE
jgi:hypothetical protein